jgi:hypothetical protein
MPYGVLDGIKKATHGDISAKDNVTETAIAEIGTFVQVTIFETNGTSYQMTPDHTNDHITVLQTGTYFVAVSCTIESVAGGAIEVDFEVAKNNNAEMFDNLHFHRRLAGGGADIGSASCSGIVSLTAADTLECWIANDTSTANIVVSDITLSAIRVA